MSETDKRNLRAVVTHVPAERTGRERGGYNLCVYGRWNDAITGGSNYFVRTFKIIF